jgi:hypothetical protein
MSEILARIRVRETHGIRRFLYPLTATLDLPPTLKLGESKTLGEMYGGFALKTLDGQNIPRQIVLLNGTSKERIDFVLSLAPGETQDLLVVQGSPLASLADPLRTASTLEGGLQNTQEHFAVTVNPEGNISEVIYDGVRHLRSPSRIRRNEQTAWHSSTSALNNDPSLFLSSHLHTKGRYEDGGFAQTKAALTACKSWVTITHTLEQAKPNDEIVFTLPLAITSPTLTCDFGVGGYVFGKLDEKAPEIVWHTQFEDAPYARWSVATAGRTDYMGEVETAEAFLPQRWFHLIDSDKAIAVAITKLPSDCRELTVRLTREGDISIAFRLGETVTGPTEFGVCYHFLNDVPAIAAATNPQSILLPPTVKLLPV